MTVITCGRYLNQKYSHETFFSDPYVFGSRTVCYLMSRWDEYEGDECVSANLRPSAQESAQEMEREKGELLGM